MLHTAMPQEASTASFFIDDTPAWASLPPSALRVEVAKLVAQNQMVDAERMLEEGLRRFPDSEDLLIMRALLSEVTLDWAAADRALQQLLSVQGVSAPVASWLHWVRVLRCMQDTLRACEAVTLALKHHPMAEALREEAIGLGVEPPPPQRQAA